MSIKSVKTEIFGMMIFSALAPDRVEKHTGSGNLVSKKTRLTSPSPVLLVRHMKGQVNFL